MLGVLEEPYKALRIEFLGNSKSDEKHIGMEPQGCLTVMSEETQPPFNTIYQLPTKCLALPLCETST